MVVGKIGKCSNIEKYTAEPLLDKRVRAYLHDNRGYTLVSHFAQHFLENQRIGSSQRGIYFILLTLTTSIPVTHRSQHSHLLTLIGENFFQQIGRGGFAIRPGDGSNRYPAFQR